MNLETLRNFFFWCFIINTGIMLYWFAFFALGRGLIFRMHGRWFKMSEEKFVAINYMLMGVYKIMIIIFNLVPWIVLYIIA